MTSHRPRIGCPIVHSKAYTPFDQKIGPNDPGLFAVRETIVTEIEQAGGTIVLIPNVGKTSITHLLDLIDGLILPGGFDVDPRIYHERKRKHVKHVNIYQDKFELDLIRECLKHHKPILGICRGMQLLNIQDGGTLYQDIPSELGIVSHTADRYPAHSSSPKTHCSVLRGSRARTIFKKTFIDAPCAHHHAVKILGSHYRVTGLSSDGVVEIIEHKSPLQWSIGFQSHPEANTKAYPHFKTLFRAFIRACSLCQQM